MKFYSIWYMLTSGIAFIIQYSDYMKRLLIKGKNLSYAAGSFLKEIKLDRAMVI